MTANKENMSLRDRIFEKGYEAHLEPYLEKKREEWRNVEGEQIRKKGFDKGRIEGWGNGFCIGFIAGVVTILFGQIFLPHLLREQSAPQPQEDGTELIIPSQK